MTKLALKPFVMELGPIFPLNTTTRVPERDSIAGILEGSVPHNEPIRLDEDSMALRSNFGIPSYT
jgi:hypothetical protein